MTTTRPRFAPTSLAGTALVILIAVSSLHSQQPFSRPDARGVPLDGSRQLLMVVTAGWDSVGGTLQRFERATAASAWTPVASPTQIVVGRNGLGWGRGVHPPQRGEPVKKEGDGRGPAGVFPLGTLFGQTRDRPAAWMVPYLFLDDNVECVDDAASAHYNQVLTKQQAGRADWASSEKMWEQPLYKWGVVVEHNMTPVQAAGGSCIFLHIWRGPTSGTAGCTAMPEDGLVALIQWLDPAARPLLVQLPRAEYERLKTAWRLP